MAVIGLHGIPGCGKTLTSVGGIALKKYRKDNRWYRKLIRKFLKIPLNVNRVYSNFPILLDKKKKIYSNVISIDDCDNRYSLIPGCIIIIDELQAFYDSFKDFNSFPRAIATFYQFHRHFDIEDIILISQSPKRVVTYLRDVISEYRRIKRFIKIPIIHLGIIAYRIVYDFDDYKYAFTSSKEIKKMYDVKFGLYFFNYKKAFKSYKSKYLHIFNKDKPLLNKGTYTSLDYPYSEYLYLNNRLFSLNNNKLRPDFKINVINEASAQ